MTQLLNLREQKKKNSTIITVETKFLPETPAAPTGSSARLHMRSRSARSIRRGLHCHANRRTKTAHKHDGCTLEPLTFNAPRVTK